MPVQPRADWRLTVAGEDLGPKVRPRLVSLTLTEARGGEADRLDLVLSDHDGKLQIPPIGADITLSLGWLGEGLVDKGRFKVDERAHDGAPDQLTLRARSADFTAELRTRQEKSWRDTTLGAVLSELASRHGLQPRVDAGLAAVALAVLQQSRESDAALLQRLGKRFDAVSTIKAGALIFAPIGAGVTAGGASIPPATIVRAAGDRHSWREAERDGGYTGVSASWHKAAGATRHTVRAGATGKVKHLRTVYAAEADARQACDAEWSRIRRGVASFDYTLAKADPALYPERRLSVRGFKPEIDATTWLVAQAVHALTAEQGFSTALQLETAP